MSVEFLFIASAVITLLVLGVLVLVHSNKESNHLFFSGFSFSLSLWVLSNYMADHDVNDSLFWTRIAFFSTSLAMGLFAFFANDYPFISIKGGAFKILLGVATVLVAITTLTPNFVPRVEFIDGVSTVIPGTLYLIYFLFFAATFSFSIVMLLKKARRGSHEDSKKVRLVLFGAVLMAVVASVTNLILPLLIKSNEYATLGSLTTIIFVSFTYYSIAKHQLLDIRALLSRGVAYVMMLGVFSLLYAGAVLALSVVLISEDRLSFAQLSLTIVIAIFIAFSWQPLQKYITRTTNRVFLRGSYDSQVVLNRLSTLLANEIDLINVVRLSSDLINKTLKPAHIRLVVFDDNQSVFYDYGTSNAPMSPVEFSKIDSASQNIISINSKSREAQRMLKPLDAELMLKLLSNDELVGVVILGPKLNGSYYNDQDIKLLEISENELSISVQNARYFDQIQKFNVTLQRKIKQATSKLEQNNKKLKELDEAKDEFISMASHQLRTPLTSIKGYVSMVVEGDAGKITPQQKKLLEEAFASSQRMVYLIADLLNVSRLKTGKFIIERSEANLAEMVDSEIAQLKPTAKSRDLKLMYHKPSRFPDVMLDETKTRQVIMNFVDNAIYYTPAGGKIEVTVKSSKDFIEFTCRDDGIGVPKEKQAKLFTKFFRADNAQKARPDGTGLGLFMARKVIVAQGGSIIFKSEEGKGSTFGFKLPRKVKK